jgi:hypothetical protein
MGYAMMINAQVDRRQLPRPNLACPICMRTMVLHRIEFGNSGHRDCTYKCLECQIVEYATIKNH